MSNGCSIKDCTGNGLYYYGARYYDPKTSVWISVDPLQEKYPNISSYAYTAQNPAKFVDPDGMQVRPARPTHRPARPMYRNNRRLYSYYNGIRPSSTRNTVSTSYRISATRTGMNTRNLQTEFPQYIFTYTTPNFNNIQVSSGFSRGAQALTLLGDLAGVKISYIEEKLYTDYGPKINKSTVISFNDMSTQAKYLKLQADWEKDFNQKMNALANEKSEPNNSIFQKINYNFNQSSYFEDTNKVIQEIGPSPFSVISQSVQKAIMENRVEQVGKTDKTSTIIPEIRQKE